jgi:phospholipid-binding lipoprotein MlaA
VKARGLAAALALALVAAPAGAVEENPDGGVQGGTLAADEDPPAADPKGFDDPWEPMNRKIFAFNETVDRFVLEPVATGWDVVVPDRVQTAIGHFFDNLELPVHFANDLLQLKIEQAYETFWRALVNTSIGLGGFFDPASYFQIKKSDEDFGQTLGYWGTPPGPYLVLPLLGPSNPRDTVGMAVDSFGTVYSYFVPFWASAGARAIDVVNRRAAVLETIREERAAAFDWYAAVRSASTQYRENRVRDRADEKKKTKEASDEDLYGDENQ